MNGTPVVITGAGVVSPLGRDLDENLRAIRAGRSGIKRLDDGDGLPERLRYAGRVAATPEPGELDRKLRSQMKFLNRGSVLGFHSAREAVGASGIDIGEVPEGRRGLYIASGDFTKVNHLFLWPATKDATGGRWEEVDYERLNKSAQMKVNPFFLLESITNNLFSFLSSYYALMGPGTSLAHQSPCGSGAVELAARAIAQGRADVALAVGTASWVDPVVMYELAGLGVLSGCSEGAASYRPLDSSCDGLIPAEGGATLVLESEEHAARRGAKILGRIRGIGNSIEHAPDGGLSPAGGFMCESIRAALRDAGCGPSELGLVVPHGGGTPGGDRGELESLSEALGRSRGRVALCGLKAYTGHMAAASDVAEIAFGMNALAERTAPATLNFRGAGERFSDMRISASEQPCGGDNLLVASYGVGGQSIAVVVGAG